MKPTDNQMLETIVKAVVQLYKHHSLIQYFASDTEARDFFLFIFFCALYVNSNGTASIAIEQEDEVVKKWNLRLLDVQNQSIKTSALYQLISLFINKVSELDSASFFKSLIKKASLLQSLVESKEVSSFSARDKVKVFERVLLRLQAMNSVDDYCDDFDYEELPDSFAELFCKAELSEDDSRSIYIPFETRCELGRYIAAYYPDVKLRIECMGQGVHHLLCMFALLNTQYIHLTQSNALSQTPNVEKGEFDIALALLQPTLNANKKNKNGDSDVKVEKLKGFFDKTRIDVDSFSSRYKEHGYIQHVLWSLKYDGKAYFYTGQGPLFRQYEKQARIHLIENNVVDVVVTLPEKLASFILPTMNLIILDKNKSTSQVKLIEGSSNFKVENAVNRLVNIDDFARAIGYQETQFLQVILVEAQQILLQDANLFFESYNVTENMSGTVEELEKHRRTLLTSFEKIQKSLTDSIFRLNDT